MDQRIDVAYVDVDGVLIVPSTTGVGPQPVFVRDLLELPELSLESPPTAKQSWRLLPLMLAPEAFDSLLDISMWSKRIRFITAHPQWSVDWILRNLGLKKLEYEYINWKAIDPENKAAAVPEGEDFIWFEDDLKPPIENALKQRGEYWKYVHVDPVDGIKRAQVRRSFLERAR